MSDRPFTIREFIFPDDYPAVLGLWQAAGAGIHVGISDTAEEIARKLARDPDLFLLAEQAGEILGSVLGGFDGRRGMVYHLAVKESYRRLGIATALMEELERRLRQKGCRKAYLMVVPGNQSGIEYYEKQGWYAMEVLPYAKDLEPI